MIWFGSINSYNLKKKTKVVSSLLTNLKQIVSIILLIAFLSFQLSELIIYVSFKINQDYIAKNLCVEKDVEGSTCKGCCQLDKKLNEQERKKHTEIVNVNILYILIISLLFPFSG